MMSEFEAFEELSEIDLNILRLKTKLKSLPETAQIKTIENQMSELLKKGSAVQAIVAKRQEVVDGSYDELSRLDSREAELREKMNGSSDYRIINSVSRDIEGIGKRREKVHFALKDQEAKLKEAKDADEKIKNAFLALKKRSEATKASFQQSSKEIAEEVEECAKRREELVPLISTDLMERYNSTRKLKSGIAVCHLLKGDVCSACRVSLAPGHVARLKRDAPFATCPECGRILLVAEEEE
jgi:uncharacterized protein